MKPSPAILAGLGTIGEVVRSVVTYRAEKVKCHAEVKKERQRAGVEHHRIDSELTATLARIEHQGKVLAGTVALVSQALAHHHDQRMQVLAAIRELTLGMVEGRIPADQCPMCLEVIRVLEAILTNTGAQMVQQLDSGVRMTQTALTTGPAQGKQ